MMGRKFENNKVKMAKTAAANAKKSSYIGKKIKVAVKSGGPDPDANRALGLIIKEAQALNVKREIVDRNIKAASSDKDGADFKELTYELYGHGGVGFVINALSDNSNRAYTDVGTVAKKANLKLAESGSVLHNFEKKGRLAVNSRSTRTTSSNWRWRTTWTTSRRGSRTPRACGATVRTSRPWRGWRRRTSGRCRKLWSMRATTARP